MGEAEESRDKTERTVVLRPSAVVLIPWDHHRQHFLWSDRGREEGGRERGGGREGGREREEGGRERGRRKRGRRERGEKEGK